MERYSTVKQTALHIAILMTGFAIMAVGILMIVNTDWGLDPWSAFHLGLSTSTGISLGRTVQLVGVIAVFFTLLLKGRKHVTWITLLNAVSIGLFIDLFEKLNIVAYHPGTSGFLYLILGLIIRSFGNAMYLSIRKGAGPRDGLMLVITERTNLPLFAVKNSMDLTVLILGALLGARIGIGTLVLALFMGPCVHFFLRLFTLLESPARQEASRID